MDFHQLRVFVEVARQKSFSRAAEKIFLTQPTISTHIRALENEIGTLLLDRSQRELQLTGAGKVLFQYAQQLLNLKKRAIFDIQKEYQIIQGHLEIVASSIPNIYVLPGLMKDFLEKHPKVTFAVKHRDTQKVFEYISEHTYDLGFVGEPIHSEGIQQIELVKDDLVLIGGPGTILPGEKPLQAKKDEKQDGFVSKLYEIDLKAGNELEDFLKNPFIIREEGSATRLVFEDALKKYYKKKELKLNVIAYLENQEAIKEAVKIGLGLAVVSYRAVDEEISGGRLKGYMLPDLQLDRSLYLVYRNNCIFSPLCNAFLEHCLNFFRIENKNPGQ